MRTHKLPVARIWNHFIDHNLHLFRGDSLVVMLYLLRRTVGFQKIEDAVSLSQFLEGTTASDGRRLNHGTGLSKKRLLSALHQLERDGHVLVERGKTARGGNLTNRYRLPVTEEALAAYASDLDKSERLVPAEQAPHSPSLVQTRVRGVGASCAPGVGATCGAKQGVPVQGVQINNDHQATLEEKTDLLPVVCCPPSSPDDDSFKKRLDRGKRTRLKTAPALTLEQLELLERIRKVGVSLSQAHRILQKASCERIKQALENLPHRNAKNPAGYFVNEVLSESFAPPKALQVDRQREVAKNRRRQEEVEAAELKRAEEEVYRAGRQAAYSALEPDQLRALVEEARRRARWASPEMLAEDSPVMQGMVLDLVAEGWLEKRLGRRESKLNLPPPRGWTESRRGRLEAREACV